MAKRFTGVNAGGGNWVVVGQCLEMAVLDTGSDCFGSLGHVDGGCGLMPSHEKEVSF